MQLSGVRPSVCLSVPSGCRTTLLQVCCCSPAAGRDIDCCSSGGRMRAVPHVVIVAINTRYLLWLND